MMEIQFDVRNQYIVRTDENFIVAKSKKYLTAAFNFTTDDWSDIKKIAIFHDTNRAYFMELIDDKCGVPWEWLNTPGCKTVSVYGGDLITANKALVEIFETGYVDYSEESSDPTQDVIMQLQKDVEELKNDLAAIIVVETYDETDLGGA